MCHSFSEGRLGWLSGLLVCLSLSYQVHAQVAFTGSSLAFPGISYFVGPNSVAVGDVNGDDQPDLIAPYFAYGTLLVFTNTGKSGFVFASSFPVARSPWAVTTADVNGDGHLDLISASAESTGGLSVLTNNGSGDFVLAATLSAPGYLRFVTAADINGDATPDLITGNSSLYVFTNNGTGAFALAGSPTPAPGNYAYSGTTADVNGDGHPDLVTVNASVPGKLSMFTNDASGGLVLQQVFAVGDGPQFVTAADVNGDHHLDLITANRTASTLTVLTNNGSGGFTLCTAPVVGAQPWGVAAADVNGDGHTDLISASLPLCVLTNSGTGRFTLACSLATSTAPNYVTAADLNADGQPDLVTANGTTLSALSVWLNTPTLSLTRSGENLCISWRSFWTDWTLQQTATLAQPNWSPSTGIADDGTNKVFTLAPVGNQFFRLAAPEPRSGL